MIHEIDKIKIKVRDGTFDDKNIEEIFGENVYQVSKVPDNATVIDLGAYIGVFALYIISLNDTAKIHCYEPRSNNFKLLKENIYLNNARDRIIPYKMAVTNEENKKRLFYHHDGTHFGGGSIYGKGDEFEDIEITTLEEILKDIEHCDILKMDIEGSEFDLLMKADPKMFKKIDFITFEWHGWYVKKYSRQVFIDLINKLSPYYRIHIIGYPITGGNFYASRIYSKSRQWRAWG